MADQHVRQWRIVALAVVSSSGRPLFLKNFPAKAAASTAATGLEASSFSTPSGSALDAFGQDAKKYLAPWALKITGEGSEPQPTAANDALPQDDDTSSVGSAAGAGGAFRGRAGASGGNAADDDDDDVATTASASQERGKRRTQQQQGPQLSLQQALSAALDFEEYTETETAQLFLYAALDRLDARRATEEKRQGNPWESRGYAVFDRTCRTGLRALVLVRYWGRTLPSDSHHPCQTVLTQLIQKATIAYCDPFRDAVLDEPLSESMVMDPFLSSILQAATELPPAVK
jgi:hypothetical protein